MALCSSDQHLLVVLHPKDVWLWPWSGGISSHWKSGPCRTYDSSTRTAKRSCSPSLLVETEDIYSIWVTTGDGAGSGGWAWITVYLTRISIRALSVRRLLQLWYSNRGLFCFKHHTIVFLICCDPPWACLQETWDINQINQIRRLLGRQNWQENSPDPSKKG